MTFLQAYVLVGIPLMLMAVAGVAVLWMRWEERGERTRGQAELLWRWQPSPQDKQPGPGK